LTSVFHFPEFHAFHSPAVKLSRHGRRSGGGVALVKKYIMPFVSHVECKYDNIVCVKISKDLLGLDKDLLFVSIYVPPYQSPFYKQSDTNCSIHSLEDFLLNLYQNGESSYLLLGGDFNARIAEWDLAAVEENDLGSFAPVQNSQRKISGQSYQPIWENCD
jgi:exonuclease III